MFRLFRSRRLLHLHRCLNLPDLQYHPQQNRLQKGDGYMTLNLPRFVKLSRLGFLFVLIVWAYYMKYSVTINCL